MFEDNGICSVCKSGADRFGDHQVGCGGNPDRIHWHNSIRDAVYSAAQSAALAPRRKVPSLIPGSQSRPANVYLPNWHRGCPAALDITVIPPFNRLVSRVQPQPRVMPYWWARPESSLPMARNASLLESPSSLVPLRPWVA